MPRLAKLVTVVLGTPAVMVCALPSSEARYGNCPMELRSRCHKGEALVLRRLVPESGEARAAQRCHGKPCTGEPFQ